MRKITMICDWCKSTISTVNVSSNSIYVVPINCIQSFTANRRFEVCSDECSSLIIHDMDNDKENLMAVREDREYLYQQLDDIDTLFDATKSGDKILLMRIKALHNNRHRIATTDGYTVKWNNDK